MAGIAAAVGFGNNAIVGEIRTTHVVIAVVSVIFFLYRSRFRQVEYLGVGIGMVFLLIGCLHVLLQPVGEAIMSEAAKLPIILIGSLAAAGFINERGRQFGRLVVPILSIAVLASFFVGDWSYYDPVRLRFGLEKLGSPNSTA